MSRRPPAPPPDLPGYTVSKLLGSGGFADVYLYEQHLPRRSVAVKVLIPGVADHELLEQFDAEANLMAALSTHPAIVTIHQAGLAGDGRPYMVMEYCSRPNLAARYRAERISVPEVLRIGVRLAGAVETAHRAGILHRDIKPANVLTTDFGHPVLSDFGISVQSATARGPQPGSSVGMSIPWSAPEVFSEHLGGDERADVYSLAATLYTVLARRSPFDRPGGPNTSADLINRIRSSPLPALGRSDVPANLERVITRAMDKNRAARYSTALDFARALQQVEGELRLSATPVDVLDEDPQTASEQIGDAPATRVRALTVIDLEPKAPPPAAGPTAAIPQFAPPGGAPVAPQALGPGAPAAPAAGQSDGALAEAGAGGRQGATAGYYPVGGHPAAPPAAPGQDQQSGRRSAMPLVLGGVALAAVIALVTILILTRGAQGPANSGQTPETLTQDEPVTLVVLPQPVQDLKGTVVDGKSVFRWRNPQPVPGDRFSVQRDEVRGTTAAKATVVTQTMVTVDEANACVVVRVVRDDGQISDPSQACARQ